jgi:hypothetical protein
MQYLKIKAFTLKDTNNNELLNIALELLEKYFNEYPLVHDKNLMYT